MGVFLEETFEASGWLPKKDSLKDDATMDPRGFSKPSFVQPSLDARAGLQSTRQIGF